MKEQRHAFITGAAGQDGYYLSEYLQSQGWKVFGLIRRHSDGKRDVAPGTIVIEGDVTDVNGLRIIFERVRPTEVYNLAAQSHAGLSFDYPIYTMEVNAVGAMNVLELCRSYRAAFYQASTSELYGETCGPLNEESEMEPANPYAVAKLAIHRMVRLYRRAYKMRAVCGILFNHESPRRSPDFVTQKICTAAAKIALGLPSDLSLGNVDSIRDWGHARDYVRAMPMILRAETLKEYVIATGESHTVREFIEIAGRIIEHRITWETNPAFLRPRETSPLKADPSLAMKELGWKPEINFEALVREMIEVAKERIVREQLAKARSEENICAGISNGQELS